MSPATCGFPPPMPSRDGARRPAGSWISRRRTSESNLLRSFGRSLVFADGIPEACTASSQAALSRTRCRAGFRRRRFGARHAIRDGTIWLESVAGKQARIREGRTRIEPVTAGRGATTAYLDRNAHSWTFSVLGRLLRSVNRWFSGRVETVSFSSVYEVREGNLWLTTEGQGLCRLRSQSIRVYSREEGLIDRNVYPIEIGRASCRERV